MPTIKRHTLSIASSLLLTACVSAPSTTYYWGNYEPAIYHQFTEESSPEEQIDALEKDLAAAQKSNQAIPPGLHAQLGMLYIQTGKESTGYEHFHLEKTLFPESAHYLDFVLKPQVQ